MKNRRMRTALLLTLALIMLSFMSPVNAASDNQVDRILSVGVDDEITVSLTPTLIIREARAGEFSETFPEVFRLHLDRAEWLPDSHTFNAERIAADTDMGGGVNPSINIRRLTDTMLEVEIETGGDGTELAFWRIPLYSKAVTPGYATVTIEPMDSAVTGGTYPYANVIGEQDGIIHATLQLLGEDPLDLQPGDAVVDETGVFVRIHESRANLIGSTPLMFRLVLENGQLFPDGTRGVDTAAMLEDVVIQGTDESLVRQLRRINATTMEITLRSDQFASEPSAIYLPLYFEVQEEGEVAFQFYRSGSPGDAARFVIGTAGVPVIEEPETRQVSFTVGQSGYQVNGEMMLSDVAPYIQPTADGLGRIMVPVRFVSEATGADEVIWDPLNRQVFVVKGDSEIQMTIGSNILLVNGEARSMDAVAEIQDIGGGLGRTMLPVAHLARALEVDYEWDPVTRTVTFMIE